MVRVLKVLMISALLLLTACGWQLRGAADTVEIDSLTMLGGSPEFRFSLEQALEDDNVLVHEESPTILVLSTTKWQTRTVALDSLGRAAEMEIKMSLRWQLNAREGKPYSERQTISTTRRYQVSSDNATGAADEDQLAREDMRREMIARIMRALSKLAPTVDQP